MFIFYKIDILQNNIANWKSAQSAVYTVKNIKLY